MPYFQAFQPFSVTVTFFMNSITFVMNHLFSYFDISICHSSNRTLSYRLLLTHGFNHGYVLGGGRSIQLSYGNNFDISNFIIYIIHRQVIPVYITLYIFFLLIKLNSSLQPYYSFESSSNFRNTK